MSGCLWLKTEPPQVTGLLQRNPAGNELQCICPLMGPPLSSEERRSREEASPAGWCVTGDLDQYYELWQ